MQAQAAPFPLAAANALRRGLRGTHWYPPTERIDSPFFISAKPWWVSFSLGRKEMTLRMPALRSLHPWAVSLVRGWPAFQASAPRVFTRGTPGLIELGHTLTQRR